MARLIQQGKLCSKISALKLGIVLVAQGIAVSACAYTYTAAPSSGDISLPGTWGGTIPVNVLRFNGPADCTISQNVTFYGMLADWGTTKIKAANGVVVTMNDNIWTLTGNMQLTGGLYDFGGTHGFLTNDGWNDTVFSGQPTKMTFDGAVLTNLNKIILQNNGNAQPKIPVWTLTNGAGLHTEGSFQMAYYGVPADGLTLTASGGSQLSCGRFESDGGNNNATSLRPHVINLSGAGTRFVSAGTDVNHIGRAYSGAEMNVSDGAELNFAAGSTYLGLEARCTSNRLQVASGAVARLGSLYLGCNGGGYNAVSVLDNATMSVVDFYLGGGHASTMGNTLVVSNATVNAKRLVVLGNQGHQNTIRLSGESPRLAIDAGERQATGNAFELQNETTLVFDVPAAGYGDGFVPITISGTMLKDGAEEPIGTYCSDGSLSIKINGAEECQRDMSEHNEFRRTYVLMQTRGGISYPDSTFEAVNATLPDKSCVFVRNVKGVGNQLCLQVKRPSGLAIIFR